MQFFPIQEAHVVNQLVDNTIVRYTYHMSYRIFQLFPIGNPAYNYCVFDFVGLRIQKINIFQVPT